MERYKKVPVKKVAERQYFYNKTRSNFAITSQVIFPEQITKELGIQPDRTFKKGPYKRDDSDTIYTNLHNCWEISSMVAIHEEESISPHIYYLKNQLKGKLDILDRYKQDPHYDLIVYIRLETEMGGMGFDLYEEELTFIHRICNRFGVYLTAVADVTITDAK
jgi:Domain of unknown function (DUF4279)